MPTILAGQVVPVFFSSDGSISITPGSAGRVSLNARAQDGSQGVAPREIYSAQTIDVKAGTTVVVEAINTDASYTASSSAGGVVDAASVQAALSSDQAGGRTALGLGTAATQASTAFLTPAQRPEVATWGDLPAANSVTVGRTYTVLATGWRVYSDGTNWRPANSELLIAARCGSLASPLATLTGITAGQFVLPVVPTIPAGLITPHSCLWVDFRFRRTTATASMQISLRLGTTGTTADSQIVPLSMSAVTNQDMRLFTSADFGASTTSFSTHAWGVVNGQSGGSANDRSTNINTAATMFVSADIAAANVADSVSLIAYRVTLKG